MRIVWLVILSILIVGCEKGCTYTRESTPTSVEKPSVVSETDKIVSSDAPIAEKIEALAVAIVKLEGKIAEYRATVKALEDKRDHDEILKQRSRLLITAIGSFIAGVATIALAFVFPAFGKWLIYGGVVLIGCSAGALIMRQMLDYIQYIAIGVFFTVAALVVYGAMHYKKLLAASWKENVNELSDLPDNLRDSLTKLLKGK